MSENEDDKPDQDLADDGDAGLDAGDAGDDDSAGDDDAGDGDVDDGDRDPDATDDAADDDDETIEESKVGPREDDADESDSKATSETKTKTKTKTKKPEGNKLLSNLVFALGFLATLALGYYVGQWVRVKFGDQPVPENEQRYRVELRGDEPQKGPDDALVTIIEFADFQCGYCAKSVEPLEDVLATYEGDVRLIFKHFPLSMHRGATPAAHAAWAAHQQGDFWEFHERLFEAKGSIAEIPNWVKERGLDASKFGRDMEAPEARRAVDGDMLTGSKVGVTGTPAFVVNGHFYKGMRDTVEWKKIIEQELEYANDIVDDGVARADLYEHLMKDALDVQVGKPTAKLDENIYKVPIDGREIRGPEDALVTIVEFADYHCTFCRQVKGDLEYLLDRYPDEVRFVYVQRPLGSLHPQARDASKAALAAAQQGKFWEYHDKLFLRGSRTMEEFEAIATELDLDLEQFRADYDSEAVNEQLAKDQKLAEQYGVNGTPAFFVNGRFLSGARKYLEFEQIVNQCLEEAKQMVANGTAPSEVYATLMADAKTSKAN